MAFVAAAACDGGGVGGGETMEIRVLPASYEFRGESYSSIAEVELVLNALRKEPVSVSISSCADESRVVDVMRLLGKRQANVAVSTFEEACH